MACQPSPQPAWSPSMPPPSASQAPRVPHQPVGCYLTELAGVALSQALLPQQ